MTTSCRQAARLGETHKFAMAANRSSPSAMVHWLRQDEDRCCCPDIVIMGGDSCQSFCGELSHPLWHSLPAIAVLFCTPRKDHTAAVWVWGRNEVAGKNKGDGRGCGPGQEGEPLPAALNRCINEACDQPDPEEAERYGRGCHAVQSEKKHWVIKARPTSLPSSPISSPVDCLLAPPLKSVVVQ